MQLRVHSSWLVRALAPRFTRLYMTSTGTGNFLAIAKCHAATALQPRAYCTTQRFAPAAGPCRLQGAAAPLPVVVLEVRSTGRTLHGENRPLGKCDAPVPTLPAGVPDTSCLPPESSSVPQQ